MVAALRPEERVSLTRTVAVWPARVERVFAHISMAIHVCMPAVEAVEAKMPVAPEAVELEVPEAVAGRVPAERVLPTREVVVAAA